MKRSPLFIPLFVLLTLLSCQKDDPQPVPVDTGVLLPDFQQYVGRFAEAAAARGVSVDLSRLRIQMVPGTITYQGSGPFCGYAYPPDATGMRRVEIARTCWDSYTDIEKELLIFHELGHAILNRGHLDSRLPSGSYRSIMKTGSLSALYSRHTLVKREYYLDELFGLPESLPEWATLKPNVDIIRIDTIDGQGTGWSFVTSAPGEGSARGRVDTAFATSGRHALKLSMDPGVNPGEACLWRYTLERPDIPDGSQLGLRVQMRLENVTGQGVALALRGDVMEGDPTGGNVEVAFFQTTEGRQRWVGDNTFFIEARLDRLDYYPDATDRLNLFLIMLPGTAGTIYFDDVVLERYY